MAEGINRDRENSLYLPGVGLSSAIRATADLADCEVLLLGVPAQHLCTVLRGLRRADVPLLFCAKGIEAGSGRLMSQVAEDEERPGAPIAVRSGPTFAHEVAAGLPTVVTLACADASLGERLVNRIALPSFRPYLSGLGDLVLTCSSTNSRNFSLGKGLGEGRSAAGLLSDRRMVAEGVFTAPVLRDRARALRVEMPVVEDVRAY